MEYASLLPLPDHVLEIHLLNVSGRDADVSRILIFQYAGGIVELDKVDATALAQSRARALVLRRTVVRDAVVAVPDFVGGCLGRGHAEVVGIEPGFARVAGDVEGLVGGIVHEDFALPEVFRRGGGVFFGGAGLSDVAALGF